MKIYDKSTVGQLKTGDIFTHNIDKLIGREAFIILNKGKKTTACASRTTNNVINKNNNLDAFFLRHTDLTETIINCRNKLQLEKIAANIPAKLKKKYANLISEKEAYFK